MIHNFTGKTIGAVFVIGMADRSQWRTKDSHWECRCICGTVLILSAAKLARGRSQTPVSCGCCSPEKYRPQVDSGEQEMHEALMRLERAWRGL